MAPAQSGFFSLYGVSSFGGVTNLPSMNLGAEVAGSRTPTRLWNTANEASGPDGSGPFELTSGLYVLAFTAAGALALQSIIGIFGRVAAITR